PARRTGAAAPGATSAGGRPTHRCPPATARPGGVGPRFAARGRWARGPGPAGDIAADRAAGRPPATGVERGTARLRGAQPDRRTGLGDALRADRRRAARDDHDAR